MDLSGMEDKGELSNGGAIFRSWSQKQVRFYRKEIQENNKCEEKQEVEVFGILVTSQDVW